MAVAGRPEKPIEWDLVDTLIEQQNSGAEISSHFNMHPETFYDRVKSKWGINFTEYAGIKYSSGKSKLRSKQWEKAIEGNVQLLLKLGEVYLGQDKSTSDSNKTAPYDGEIELQVENMRVNHKNRLLEEEVKAKDEKIKLLEEKNADKS